MVSLAFDKAQLTRSSAEKTEMFESLRQPFIDQINEAECQLAQVKLETQKLFTEFAENCQFVSQDVSSNDLVSSE